MTKKDKIITTATKLFAEQGFENTSVSNICQEADVSKGLVYHHFKSKEEILIEIFTLTTEKMVEMNNQPKSALDPNIQLAQLIETIFSQLKNDKLFFQLNLNVMFQPSTKKLLETQIKERSTILFESVKYIFAQINPEKSTTLSYMFIAEIDGVAFHYLSLFEEYPIDKMKAHLIQKYRHFSNLIT